MSVVSSHVFMEVFEVLVKGGGASIDDLSNFLAQMDRPLDGPREFSFRGNLGFGGKIYFEETGFRVSCYPEDETPERTRIISKLNNELKSIGRKIRNV